MVLDAGLKSGVENSDFPRQRLHELGVENKRLDRLVEELQAQVRRLEERLLSPLEREPSEQAKLAPANFEPRVRRPGREMIEDDQDLWEAEANGVDNEHDFTPFPEPDL